ncbi:UNVERIFIED_CONTAM: hypothetical protein GTU68_009769 [Idotea baltica]|nr:hypothetical protein [Idotea baltica]
MSLETYQSLKQAVELGRWPDGKQLSSEQRQNAMQAIIAWGQVHLPTSEQVGHIDKAKKEGDQCDEPDETPLMWKD